MSLLLSLKGRSSILSTDFLPPIQLDPENNYGLALLSFHSYNSIPNIEKKNCKLYLIDSMGKVTTIHVPEGSYEINDIEAYIQKVLQNKSEKVFSLKANNNTLKCEIYSEKYSIDFQPEDSIAEILGFSAGILEPKRLHISDLPVNVIKVRTIHLETNITGGAFYNDTPSHTIYEFAIDVDPGYAIDETPKNLIYLPVTNRREIHNITLRVLNQNFEVVNFRGEEIIVRLELKQLM